MGWWEDSVSNAPQKKDKKASELVQIWGLPAKNTIQHVYMGVSKNSSTPKSSILIGISIINHPFWGTPIFGNTHMYTYLPRTQQTSFFCFSGVDLPFHGSNLPKYESFGFWINTYMLCINFCLAMMDLVWSHLHFGSWKWLKCFN